MGRESECLRRESRNCAVVIALSFIPLSITKSDDLLCFDSSYLFSELALCQQQHHGLLVKSNLCLSWYSLNLGSPRTRRVVVIWIGCWRRDLCIDVDLGGIKHDPCNCRFRVQCFGGECSRRRSKRKLGHFLVRR